MAKKDVDEYFNEMVNNYHEMILSLKELEEEASKGLIDPDKLEQMKLAIEPLKVNYQRISYIMYLLNKPTKKIKHKKYDSANSKLLSNIDNKNTLHGVIEENKQVIDEVKKVKT